MFSLYKPLIIMFTGTVGSGKSTQMKLLYLRLKEHGLRPSICFLKSGHIFAYILEIFLTKILLYKKKDAYPIRILMDEKSQLFKRIFKLWLILDLLSITLKYLIQVYIPLKMGHVVLVEEYIPATIADYIYISKVISYPLKIKSPIIHYLLKLTNQSNNIYIIFLDAENNKLATRWRIRGSFMEREDYIDMQRTLLLRLSKFFSDKFLYIDTGADSINEVHKLILNLLSAEKFLNYV